LIELGRVEIAKNDREAALSRLERAASLRRTVNIFPGITQYNLSQGLSLVIPLLPAERQKAAADEAVAAFRTALDSSFALPPSSVKDLETDFAALLDRPDFQELVKRAKGE
jgi:hypothetical protein